MTPTRHGGFGRTYRLTFPAGLQVTQVHAWLRAVGGTLRSPRQRDGRLALELHADDRGLVHRLVVPVRHADYVVAQLRSLVPGVRVVPETAKGNQIWTTAVELRLTHLDRRLYVASAEQVSTSLLASVQGLGVHDAVMVQFIITPAATGKPPASRGRARSSRWHVASLLDDRPENDGITDRRHKLDEPNYLVALRLAVQADTEERAVHLLARVGAVLTSTRSPNTRFKKKLTWSKTGLFKRIEQASGNLLYGAQLSVSEQAAIIGWPLGSPHVAGLPQGRTRQLPTTAAIPWTGWVIGTSNFPGDERPVAISPRDAVKHLHVLGPTGVGKTTLLANIARQQMIRNYGVIILESKGDLFNAALNSVPRRRIKDVIVLDVNDTAYPVGFNVLNAGTSHAAVDELSALITGIYGDHGGIYAPMILYFGLHALRETPGSTFIDLPSMITPQGSEETAWRDQVVRSVKNRDVRQFWQRYLDDTNKERDRMAAPVHNRIWQLTVRPEIRNIIGQSVSSFTFEDVLSSGKILLINLNGVRVGEQTASLTGTLLMNALYAAVRTVRMKKPCFLFLDEFQDFVSLPVNAADLLAKTRSFGLGLVLSHQDLDQLSKVRGLEQAVLANARSKVVFQTSSRDARVMQREFGRLVSDDDFINLGAYEAIARIATPEGVSAPITLTTKPLSEPTGLANAVRVASRTTYGRPVAQVEAEIDGRRRLGDDHPKKKPKLGPQKWE
ncbi:MAG TPA: type IV secretion system DNA-binding domain-containing protein [Pseudonocardiaceae bacterium]|jgi:hypothetical protein|nr:type IV secretion system DNA-binding domain-containing protein [Pseudonocardiaceae bacterium]